MCYAFFFAVYIFVDERCPRDARARRKASSIW